VQSNRPATPLRPIVEALLAAARRGLHPDSSLDAFVPALAGVVPEWGERAATDSALVLGEAILRLLSAWAAPGTTTLVVEDLHWADPESLAVLEYLADNLSGAPVLLVATLRTGVPGPGTELAHALISRRVAGGLSLEPLAAADVVAMAESCLRGEALPPGAADALVLRSEGVPFFVEELLAAAVRTGWASLDDVVPGPVATSVSMRLDAAPAGGRALLVAAAVMGRQFDWTVAADAAGVGHDEAAELFRYAARDQLVDADGRGLRFRHALTRDAVLATSSAREQATLAARALPSLRRADPSLTGERGELAATLAAIAGDHALAANLWLQAARRATDGGSLVSARALATRARAAGRGRTIDAADDLLLRIFALAGHTEQAAELGQQLLARRTGTAERADIHLLLGTVDLAGGRWDAAEEHATATRALVPDDTARLARADALAAQAAMGRDDLDTAIALAEAARAGAQRTTQPAVECEALEVIGRAQRGRDLTAAEAAFAAAHTTATAAGLALWQVRAMQELGTIDMFGSCSVDRLLAARRQAIELGALSTAAVIDLQLGAVYAERGDLIEALGAARRSEEASRRFGLSTLPMSLVIQAITHARLGDRAATEAAFDAALATGEDRDYVLAGGYGQALAVIAVVEGDLARAAAHCDVAMVEIRRRPGAALPIPGLWSLLRTRLGQGGDAARAEVAALGVDTPVSRELNLAAEAIAAGRAGAPEAAVTTFATADAALAQHQGGFRRALGRLLVAPAAHGDGWGEPVAWLRESLALFEGKGLDALAARARVELRATGAPVPRKGRGDAASVPPELAALGITSREADVLALVAEGLTNREVGERLFISTRTVDKHVERLLLKAATTRSGLAPLARRTGS